MNYTLIVKCEAIQRKIYDRCVAYMNIDSDIPQDFVVKSITVDYSTNKARIIWDSPEHEGIYEVPLSGPNEVEKIIKEK